MALPKTSRATYGNPPPPIPPVDPNLDLLQDATHATKCRARLDFLIRYDTVKRAALERTWNRAMLYDANRQWLRPLLRGIGSGLYWFQWEPITFGRKDPKFPMPQRNIFSPAMQDETSRLLGVGAKPYVRVDDHQKEDGALAAKHILLDRNEKTGWDDDARLGSWHAPMFGQWINRSTYRPDVLKQARGPVLGAVQCTTCQPDVFMASPTVDREALGTLAQNPRFKPGTMAPQGNNTWKAEGCPLCGSPMEPVDLPKQTYLTQPDVAGRPLYEDRTVGEDITEVVDPHSFFPCNGGIGYNSDENMPEFALRTPRTLEWIRTHIPSKNLHQVKETMGAADALHHPVIGGAGLTAQQENQWAGWYFVDEYFHKPCADHKRGRHWVMVGNVLLLDVEYYWPDTDIERSVVNVAQWEQRKNEIWGKGMGEDLFSVQDNINGGLSQNMDMAHKWTSPKMFFHKGQNLTFAGGLQDGYHGDAWQIDSRGIPPEIAGKFPMVFGDKGNPGSLWQMYDRDKDYVADATGARGAEIGNVSGVELNYSALLFAATKSAERRKPRTEAIRRLKRRQWTHRLRNIAYFYTEEVLVHYRDDKDKLQVRQMKGFHLKNQTDVALEDEPLVDSGIAKRASIEQGITWGTIKTSANGGSYGADRRINRAIEVPDELNEDRNIQEDHAVSEWRYWMDEEENLEPIIDQQSDDPIIHIQQHNLSLDGREGQMLKDRLKQKGTPWSAVLRATWEWEKMWRQLSAMSQAAARPIDDAQAIRLVTDSGIPPEEVAQLRQKQQQAAVITQSWPAVLELQVFDVWMRLLVAHGVIDMGDPGALADPMTGAPARAPRAPTPPDQDLLKLVRFKCHALGHWLKVRLAEEAEQKAMMEAQQAAAGPQKGGGGGGKPGGGGPPKAAPAPGPAQASGAPPAQAA